MTDTEMVYALYVQANPVPDPEALPLTLAEAELLTHERSRDMDTQERIEVRPAPKVRPRRRSLAFGLAAILVVAAVAVSAFLVAGGGDDPVAAADAAPRITFDGTTCRYDGPTLIETGTVAFTVSNTGTEAMQFVGFNMPESSLDAELERTPLGTNMPLDPTAPMPDGAMSFLQGALPGAEGVTSWPMTSGTNIIDCVTEATDHVWRAGTLVEFVAP